MNKNFKLSDFKKAKKTQKPIVALTAYDFPTAYYEQQAGIDFILVGDSMGMVCYGRHNTLQVTLEDVIKHSQAVRKGAPDTFVVGDMPFLTYQISTQQAVENAGKLISQGDVDAVKVEGGQQVVPQIKSILDCGIAVMGHLGLTPQSISKYGGYRVQGKTVEKARKIYQDALILEELGVFSIVLEFIPEELAELITEKITIPTIGIGSGNKCDGQILVINDLMNFNPDVIPKFVRTYANLGQIYTQSITQFSEEVRCGKFPGESESTKIKNYTADEYRKLIEEK